MKKSHILAYIETGTVNEIMTIMNRLHFLPEFGMQDRVSKVAALANEVTDAEIALSQKIVKLRGTAEYLIRQVEFHWTAEQIADATGY